jgi:hypothetical protein
MDSRERLIEILDTTDTANKVVDGKALTCFSTTELLADAILKEFILKSDAPKYCETDCYSGIPGGQTIVLKSEEGGKG